MINNQERFNIAPSVDIPRSVFLMHQNHRTTFNAGVLVPIYVDSDITPGDTFDINQSFVIRQITPIKPTMDNSYFEIFWVFVPHRLAWEHWAEFWGENKTGSWTQQTTYTVPQLKLNTEVVNCVYEDDILHYMGVPLTKNLPHEGENDAIYINALPLRAYQITWNELFRDENVAAPMAVNTGDSDTKTNRNIYQGNGYWWGTYHSSQKTSCTSRLAPVFKYKDYFNAGLPEPQKGTPITLPIGETAPVLWSSDEFDTTNKVQQVWYNTANGTPAIPNGASYVHPVGMKGGGGSVDSEQNITGGSDIYIANKLYADLSNAVAATINAQRMAFAAQRILEANARAGTRYWEILNGIFQVKNPNQARLQRPEYLGGSKTPITMQQVPQTSSTDNTTPQGNLSAFSQTADSRHALTHSFTEHGTLLCLACVRYEHSYSQGLSKMWSRKDKLDFFHPQLNFLGEQPILTKEIYLGNDRTKDDTVFAYNERWAEYRYKTNLNTGLMDPMATQTLSIWHYGDEYSGQPVLSMDWRMENANNITRTLAIQNQPQYMLDFRVEMKATRSLATFSIPGLMDHY